MYVSWLLVRVTIYLLLTDKYPFRTDLRRHGLSIELVQVDWLYLGVTGNDRVTPNNVKFVIGARKRVRQTARSSPFRISVGPTVRHQQFY
jgi:hypothetical protein